MPTTTTVSLVETVQSLYAAFGRGDIASVLAGLRPDVNWAINADPANPTAATIPILRPFTGRADVGQFFSALARDMEFHVFEPVGFTSGPREVAARIKIEATVRTTRRRMKVDSLHHFTFDESGLVSAFREFTDTLAIAAAWGRIPAAG
jgi:uncharacterized protein